MLIVARCRPPERLLMSALYGLDWCVARLQFYTFSIIVSPCERLQRTCRPGDLLAVVRPLLCYRQVMTAVYAYTNRYRYTINVYQVKNLICTGRFPLRRPCSTVYSGGIPPLY